MKVLLKRFDKTIPLPEYKTPGAAATDLYSREEVTIEAGSIGYIPLNIAVEIPKGTWLMVAPRSSAHKLGIMSANGIGIVDEDYNGDNDELNFIAYNFTDKIVTIEKGTRIAQMMVMNLDRMDLEEVDHLDNEDRGGIGSTGSK